MNERQKICHIIETFNGTSRMIYNYSYVLLKFWDKDEVGEILYLSSKNFTIFILEEEQCLLQTCFFCHKQRENYFSGL